MATTATNPNLEQSYIEPVIIDSASAQERSVLGLFKNYKSNGEPFQILVEQDDANYAQGIGEKSSPSIINNKFNMSKLNPKRFATAIELSKKLMDNSAIDYRAHVRDILTRRLVTGIESQITSNNEIDNPLKLDALSKGGHGPNYVSANSDGGPIELSVIETTVNTFIINGRNKKENAFWVFKKFPKVLDELGNSIVTFNDLPKGAVARILDIPVYVANLPIMTDNVARVRKFVGAVLVNPDAYAFSMSDIKITEEVDLKTKMHVFTAECWVEGKKVSNDGIWGIEYAPLNF